MTPTPPLTEDVRVLSEALVNWTCALHDSDFYAACTPDRIRRLLSALAHSQQQSVECAAELEKTAADAERWAGEANRCDAAAKATGVRS